MSILGLTNSPSTRVTKSFPHIAQTCQGCILQEDFISRNVICCLFVICFCFGFFSTSQRDFLSLELVDGKVRLTVDLGSGPLVLTTDNHYNNGTWYKISFNRNKKQGRRQIEKSRCQPIYKYKYLRWLQGTSLQPNLITSNAVSLAVHLCYFAFRRTTV